MDSSGGSDSLPDLVGKTQIVLASAEKKRDLTAIQAGLPGARRCCHSRRKWLYNMSLSPQFGIFH